MTPEQRKSEEEKIKNNFSELQKTLGELRQAVEKESDETKKQEKKAEIDKMEEDLNGMKSQIDTLSSLQEQDLQLLKERLEQCNQVKQDVQWEVADLQNERISTPSTYELLKDSETCERLKDIIKNNPKNFEKMLGDTPEAKLEYIFSKIHNSVFLFLKNKLWAQDNSYDKIIENTISPAFEWSMMEMLRDQWNETNVSMLKGLDKISRDSLGNLVSWVAKFAGDAKWSYDKFNQWINAIDYLSVHNWVLRNPEKSAVLTSPVEFKKYLNNANFLGENFSPYVTIKENLFKIDENQTFQFWMSLQEKQNILNEIWKIQVANNPRTTSLIAKMIDKPEKFLWSTAWLQKTANGLLDWIDTINTVTKIFWTDLIWEVTKAPEKRNFLFKILDFVCKLIWITWWLEWIVKKWRLDRLSLDKDKNNNISQIFKEYQKLVWKWDDISITDENSCKTILKEFDLSDGQSTTKWDYLRDVMIEKMDLKLISPSVVEQTLWREYLKKETDWKQREKIVVDTSKITDNEKKLLARKHIDNIKTHLIKNYSDLTEFYSNIHNMDDLAICITASLYADKNDVIEGIKAKVFLPENYKGEYTWDDLDGSTGNWTNNPTNETMSDLSSNEKAEMDNLVEQSKKPNRINYLENPTYKKYLNIIERDLKLPKYSLESVCYKESWWWYLYDTKGNILWSPKWAKWLFQFIDATSDTYMKHSQLKEKYWKTFTSRTEFLKDPLATAWAAGIIYSELMHKNNYNFQSALACYNRWQGHYQDNIGKRNLTSWDMKKLPGETKDYVESITKKVMDLNSVSWSDVLTADLWRCLWNEWSLDAPESDNELLIWPKLLAENKDEIWWLWDSIMKGFQWLDKKTNFPNMDWVVSKNTRNHPHRFTSKNDVVSYKSSHPNIKSFMLYFWANNNNNQQTLSDIKQWSEWLEAEWIQPVLCTCVWEDSTKTPWLKDLNQQLIALWKEKSWPVVDFAKSYNKWDIALQSDWVHPQSYSPMVDIVNGALSQA